MRKLSYGTWAAVAATVALAALTGSGLARVWRAPPVPTALDGVRSVGERRLVVGGDNRALIVEESAAYRVDAAARATVLTWPAPLRIAEIKSLAYRPGKLALTVKAYDTDPEKTYPAVLLVGDRAVERVYTPSFDAKRAHVSNVLAAAPEEGEPKDAEFAVYVQEDASLYRLPFSHGWAKGDDDARHRLEAQFWPDTVERIVWREGEGPIFLCANRRRQLDERLAPVVPTTALDLFGYERPLPELSPDEKDVIARVLRSDKLESVSGAPSVGGVREVTVGGRAVASLAERDSFLAAPLGARWLLLGREHPQALVLDASGARLDRVSRAQTIRALTDEPSWPWLGLGGALAAALLALVLVIARALTAGDLGGTAAAERVEPNARGVFFGVLRVPEGALLETDARGHVQVASGCRVRVGACDVELGPGLERGDAPSEVPLIDGDAVFVVGRLEGDGSEGPWRGSGRLRLVADGGRHAIGRGDAHDFVKRVSAGRDRRVLRLALVTLGLEIALLGRFAFAVFG